MGIDSHGRAGAGPISVLGLVPGNRVLYIAGFSFDLSNFAGFNVAYETVITVADQIQQTDASDLSSYTMVALIQTA